MLKEQKIIVDISTSGEVTIDVNGVDGTQCLGLTKGLEEKLGKNIDRKMKSQQHTRNESSRNTIDTRS